MEIITRQGQINCENELVSFIFKDDNELNQFLNQLATSEVKTSGVRILSMIGENVKMNETQKKIFQILGGLDGIGGKENEQICDEAINKLNELINKAK
jgi:hypothetical protein